MACLDPTGDHSTKRPAIGPLGSRKDLVEGAGFIRVHRVIVMVSFGLL